MSSKAVSDTADVVIIGGGVMGCASALALAKAGARVTVLERSVPGAEASSAAAGILGAQTEAHEPGAFFDLARKSLALYPDWAEALRSATGIDIGFRRSGVLHVAFDEAAREQLHGLVEWQRLAGLSIEYLDAAGVREKEPWVTPRGTSAVRFADDGRVDPPLLLKAVHIAAAKAGAHFRSGAYVRSVDVDGGVARGVILEDGTRIGAGRVVLAAGSWSTLVAGVPIAAGSVRPARGQIVELEMREPPLNGVVFGPACYLVPRDDGRVLIGSTLEFVGYRREVTARAVRDLLAAAIDLVPGLADATLGRAWSNFRPYSETGNPLLGPTAIDRLLLATGHHRNGILLAPITAEIVCAVAMGRPAPVDLAPFRGR
jgi:glycine oxidase